MMEPVSSEAKKLSTFSSRSEYNLFSHSARSSFIASKYSLFDLKGLKGFGSSDCRVWLWKSFWDGERECCWIGVTEVCLMADECRLYPILLFRLAVLWSAIIPELFDCCGWTMDEEFDEELLDSELNWFRLELLVLEEVVISEAGEMVDCLRESIDESFCWCWCWCGCSTSGVDLLLMKL